MRVSNTLLVCVLVNVLVVAWANVLHLQPKHNIRPQSAVRWCTLSPKEQAKCQALALHVKNDVNARIQIECHQRSTRVHCFWEIRNGNLDAISAWRSQAYFAAKHYGLYPLIGEEYFEGGLQPRDGSQDEDNDDDNDDDDIIEDVDSFESFKIKDGDNSEKKDGKQKPEGNKDEDDGSEEGQHPGKDKDNNKRGEHPEDDDDDNDNKKSGHLSEDDEDKSNNKKRGQQPEDDDDDDNNKRGQSPEKGNDNKRKRKRPCNDDDDDDDDDHRNRETRPGSSEEDDGDDDGKKGGNQNSCEDDDDSNKGEHHGDDDDDNKKGDKRPGDDDDDDDNKKGDKRPGDDDDDDNKKGNKRPGDDDDDDKEEKRPEDGDDKDKVNKEIVTRRPIPRPRSSFMYIAVVVIRKNNTRIRRLSDLRGSKSCHTAIGRNAGWVLPMSLLMARGLLTGKDCLDNVESVSKFFSKSCVPGSQDPIYNSLGTNVSNLCQLCSGDAKTKCTLKDPYAGYHGAMKCLLDGKGDIAFVKHSTAKEVLKGETRPGRRSDNFELLCPDGNRQPLDGYRQCNWGVVPTQAVFVSHHLSPQSCQDLRALLLDIANNPKGFNLFDSKSYGGRNLLFRDNTKELYEIKTKDYRDHTGPSYIRAMENQTIKCEQPQLESLRWCVTSHDERIKCGQMRVALDTNFVKPHLKCIQGRNVEDCAKKIKNNQADLITLDGGELFTAGRANGLSPLLYEEYGKHTNSYWSVAVVKKSDHSISWNNLQGRSACFSGVKHAAGWSVPIYQLWKSGHLNLRNRCNLLNDISSFFGSSCTPGAMRSVVNKTTILPSLWNLCELCTGKGNNHCINNKDEPYYGFAGALRCLVEGGGDVAFVNELTVLENTDGYNNAQWANHLRSNDFELLCKDGSRRPIARYHECNLGKVPSNVVAARASRSPQEVNGIIHALLKAQHFFKNDSNIDFRLFDSELGSKDLLFRDATHCLEKVKHEFQDPKKWLGEFYPIAQFISEQQCAAQI